MTWWRVLFWDTVKYLKGKPFNVSNLVFYTLTIQSTEEEIEKFYSMLGQTQKSPEITVVMGDVNTKVGKGVDDEIRTNLL